MNRTHATPHASILTPAELATMLRVSTHTITNMANRGDIEGAFKVGSQWRFHADLAVPHLCPRPATVSRWHDAPASASTNAQTDDGASDGANPDASAKKADSTPKRKRRTARTKSGSAFARDFPEHANIVRSAS